jgi:hypothetical protein
MSPQPRHAALRAHRLGRRGRIALVAAALALAAAAHLGLAAAALASPKWAAWAIGGLLAAAVLKSAAAAAARRRAAAGPSIRSAERKSAPEQHRTGRAAE